MLFIIKMCLIVTSFLSPSSDVFVPVGGKKLLTFMDDFNMPAKDTFGSQPPLELIRQWLDYGFWYDRLKQTVKRIKVYIYMCVCNHVLYRRNGKLCVFKVMRFVLRKQYVIFNYAFWLYRPYI